MTLRLIIWAMATGFITGTVWFAIHFLRRGGSIPLASRDGERHDAIRDDAMHNDALSSGAADSVNRYQPIVSADQDSRNLHAHVKAPTGETPPS